MDYASPKPGRLRLAPEQALRKLEQLPHAECNDQEKYHAQQDPQGY